MLRAKDEALTAKETDLEDRETKLREALLIVTQLGDETKELLLAKGELEAQRLRIRENRMKRSVQGIQNRCLVLTFDAWKLYSLRQKRNKYMIARCSSAMSHRVQVAAWRSWVDFVEWRQDARETLALWETKVMRRDQYRGFTAWVEGSRLSRLSRSTA